MSESGPRKQLALALREAKRLKNTHRRAGHISVWSGRVLTLMAAVTAFAAGFAELEQLGLSSAATTWLAFSAGVMAVIATLLRGTEEAGQKSHARANRLAVLITEAEWLEAKGPLCQEEVEALYNRLKEIRSEDG